MIEIYNIDSFIGQAENGWINFLSIFFAALVPFLLFYKGIRHEKKKELQTQKQELETLSQYFIHLLKRVVGNKIYLVNSDRKTQSAYINEPMARHDVMIEMAGDLTRLSKLDAKEIRNALYQSLAGSVEEVNQIFTSVYAIIDYYLEHSKYRLQRINFNSKQRDKLGERLVNALDDFRLDLWKILILRKTNKAEEPVEACLDIFYLGLQNYEHHVAIGTSRDMGFAKKNVLHPVFEASEKYREIEQVFPELYRNAYKLGYLFSRVEACGIDLKDSLQSINNNLKEQNEKLTDIVQTHFDPNFNPNQKEIKNNK